MFKSFNICKVRDETNLASSSIAETGDPNDLLGVIVSYSVKVIISNQTFSDKFSA
jgi:hypothetical protein